MDLKKEGEQIIIVKFIVEQGTFNIISVQAPQVGLVEDLKVKLWKNLEGLFQNILQGENIFEGRDLNGHVGSVLRGFAIVHMGYGLRRANAEDKSILEFSLAFDLTIVDTRFWKRDEHFIP